MAFRLRKSGPLMCALAVAATTVLLLMDIVKLDGNAYIRGLNRWQPNWSIFQPTNLLDPHMQFNLVLERPSPFQKINAGDCLGVTIAANAPENQHTLKGSYFRILARGQHSVTSPIPVVGQPGHYSLCFSEPDTYNITARLWEYDIDDWLHTKGWDGVTKVDGQHNQTHDLPIMNSGQIVVVRPSPVSMQPHVSSDAKECVNNLNSTIGTWLEDVEHKAVAFRTLQGCEYDTSCIPSLSDVIPSFLSSIAKRQMPKWIRLIGDSNTRFILQHGFCWDDMRIPGDITSLFAGGAPSFPCIWHYNEVSGKDELFLCLLFYDEDPLTPPMLFTMEWFTLHPTNSPSLTEVLPRTLKEAFESCVQNNGPRSWLSSRTSARIAQNHTFETFLAPWPELQALREADHTFLSFGSHNVEASQGDWQRWLEQADKIWKSEALLSAARASQQRVTLLATQAVNSFLIPDVRKAKFEHVVRNNLRMQARNALLRVYASSHGSGETSTNNRLLRMSYMDFYNTSEPMLDSATDAVHYQRPLYRVHARMILSQAFEWAWEERQSEADIHGLDP